MLLSTFIEKEDLRFFETTVEKQSLRLGYNLSCHLIGFDKQSSSLQKRKQLREHLVKTIEKKFPKKLSLEQKNVLLTPGGVPQTPFASVSISHCALMGGFVISQLDSAVNLFYPPTEYSSNKPLFIGFDLEQLGRAKEKTVLRISNKKELAQAPSPSALWSAKEAAYKSISSLQSDIHIKHISIFDWQSIVQSNTDTKIYDYQFITANKNIKGKGFICCLKNIITGLAFSFFPLPLASFSLLPPQ